MPYNTELEQKIDRLTGKLGTFAKKKMFGGVGYLMNGKMAFGIHKQELIIRTAEDHANKLLKKEFFSVFDITGRPMKGWLTVSPKGLKSDQQLFDLLKASVDYVKNI
jgi:hypothetical protein